MRVELSSWERRVRDFLTQLYSRRMISPALVVLGLVLLGYVGAQYGQMYLEQRHLAVEWQQQQHARTVALHTGSNGSHTADDGLTRLFVPKIDLDSIVLEGTNHKALLLGPGHLKATPAPGELGNSVISGHRDTFFRHIHELEKGDAVYVERDGKTYKYEVTGKKIVEPDDLSVIRPVKDAQLTLITCYPTYYIGPAPKRLVVFSKLVGQPEEAQAAAAR